MIVGKGTGFINHTAPGWTVFTDNGYLYFQLNAAGVFGISELQAQDVNGYSRLRRHLAPRRDNVLWKHVCKWGCLLCPRESSKTPGNDINDLNAGDITNDADPTIGATPTPSGFYHGALAELDVFNRTLTTADNARLYGNGAGDYGAVGVQAWSPAIILTARAVPSPTTRPTATTARWKAPSAPRRWSPA